MQHLAEVAADCHVSADESRQVPVILSHVSACRQCARGSGCGAGLLTLGQGGVELLCLTDQSVRRGQRVTIETDDPGSQWLSVVLIAFGLPILGLALGMTIGTVSGLALGVSGGLSGAVTGSITEGMSQGSAAVADWPAAAGAIVGLCGGVLAWHKVAPHLDRRASTGLCHDSARIVNIDSDS